MSYELGDELTDVMSECCDSLVNLQGFCSQCLEHA